MNQKAISTRLIIIINTTLIAMTNANTIQKVHYYSKSENIEQAATIGAVMRIIAGESDLKAESLILRNVRLLYPKNQNSPITTAYATSKVSAIKFKRLNDKVNWETAIIHTGHGDNDAFEALLPSFDNKDFDKLKLILSKTAIEDRADSDQTDNNEKVRYHKIHVFYYIFKAKNDKIVDVAFEVEKNIYKLGDEYPKHFSRVLITLRR